MEQLISIIIPVYNGEKFIERCILTILGQTYEKKEIVIVDDGSTDHTYFICQKLQSEHEEIKLYKKSNGGAASARNYGIKVSSGELVTFVDVDDYVYPHYIEYLYKLKQKYQADISVCACYKLGEDENIPKFPEANKNLIFNKEQALKNVIYRKEIVGYPGAKLYCKSKIAALKFPEDVKYGEDFFFVLMAIEQSNKIVYGNNIQYIYVQNMNSISHAISNMECIRSWQIHQKRMEEFLQKYPQLYKAVCAKMFILATDYYCRIRLNGNKDSSEKHFLKYMEANCKIVLSDKESKKINRMMASICCISGRLMGELCIIFLKLSRKFKIEVRKSV